MSGMEKKKMAACRIILINKCPLQLVWDACTHWEVSPVRSCGVYSEEPSPHPSTSPHHHHQIKNHSKFYIVLHYFDFKGSLVMLGSHSLVSN